MPADGIYSLPFEQQIGQFFSIGLPGTDFDEETRTLIEEIKPGGVIIFGRNVDSPDQLRAIFTPMPSARAIRQHGDLAGVRTLGRVTGELLRRLGFNINFAPVMSIMTEQRDLLSNGLYSRSYGRSPGEVLGYTTVYMRGLQGTGCLGCLKHFPG